MASLQQLFLLGSPAGFWAPQAAGFGLGKWLKAAVGLVFELSLHLTNLDISCSNVYLNFSIIRKKYIILRTPEKTK